MVESIRVVTSDAIVLEIVNALGEIDLVDLGQKLSKCLIHRIK